MGGMDQPAVRDLQGVRDDAARLKRLPVRRSAAPSPAQSRRVVGNLRLVAPPLIGLTALSCALAPLTVIGDVTRACIYGGMLTAVGVGAFALVVYNGAGAPREMFALRQLTLAAALVAVVASAIGLGVEIVSISGQGLAGATNADAAAIAARNGFCASVLLRVIGLGVFAFAVYYEADVWTARLFGTLGAALICVSCALTGHEATHGFAVRLAVALHVLAASIWAGGLVALGITLRARRRASDLVGGAVVVRRFSIVMSSTVAVLIAAGIVLTCLVLGPVGRLLTTNYGLVLSTKIALATAVVAVAAFNQRRLVPAVVAQSTRGWNLLARTVLVEQGALLVVVALTAVLVNLDPGS
jgi:putative copper export protein